MMEEVEFRYILKSNHDVEISGTVHIPEDENAEDHEFEIEFDRAGTTPSWNLFINHYGVGVQRTAKEDAEIEELKEAYCTDFMFLTRICDFAHEETNGVVELDKAYLVVNGFDFETWVGDH